MIPAVGWDEFLWFVWFMWPSSGPVKHFPHGCKTGSSLLADKKTQRSLYTVESFSVFDSVQLCWSDPLHWIYCKSTMFTGIWPLWACTKYGKIVSQGKWKPQRLSASLTPTQLHCFLM